MRRLPDLDEETVTQFELHAALEAVLGDGRITADELQVLKALVTVWRNSITRLDTIANNQRAAIRLIQHGLRTAEEAHAVPAPEQPATRSTHTKKARATANHSDFVGPDSLAA